MIITGVGSRKTPGEILGLMAQIGKRLAERGHVLRSGGAMGADRAFETGFRLAGGACEIYRPEHAQGRPDAFELAGRFHPVWSRLPEKFQALHARNSFQVMGLDLKTPSDGLICWTPDGARSHAERSRVTGGTGTAISISDWAGVKVWNLAVKADLENWAAWLSV
jgi:hypothetical protein